MSAERGMSEWTANGNDYIINDPNNAEEFDPTKDYAVRDHVYHEGILHVFVTPHPAGAWNASHVLAIKVGTELANLWNANDTEATLRANADNDLKSALNNKIDGEIIEITDTTRNLADLGNSLIGKAWNYNPSTARAVIYIPVSPSTQYTFSIGNHSFETISWFEKAAKEDTTSLTGYTVNTNPFTKTTNASANWIVLQFNKTNISLEDLASAKIQLESGSTRTAFVQPKLVKLHDVVRFDTAQELTDENKKIARENIDSASNSDIEETNNYIDNNLKLLTVKSSNLIDFANAIIGKAWNLVDNSARAIVPIPVSPSTLYHISYEQSAVDTIFIAEKETLESTTSTHAYTMAGKYYEFTTQSNTHYVIIQFNKNGIGFDDVVSTNIQMLAGGTAELSNPTREGKLPSDVYGIFKNTENRFDADDVKIGVSYKWDDSANRATFFMPVTADEHYFIVTYSFPFDLIFVGFKNELYDAETVGTGYNYEDNIRNNFTVPANANWMFVQFNKTGISKNDFDGFKMQIKQGVNIFTDYVKPVTAIDYESRSYVFNVKDFGAKGDGSTDDTQAFKTAISQAITLRKGYIGFDAYNYNLGFGFKLYIPSGKYVLNDTINIPAFIRENNQVGNNVSPITIEGDGSTATILDFSNCESGKNGIEIDGSMCRVKGVKIYKAKNYGLYFKNRAWKGECIDVTVERSGSTGFFFGQNSFDMIVSHCLAYLCNGIGFYFDTGITSTTISNNYANSCNGVAFFFAGTINYSSLINNAVDSCGTAYRFGTYCYVSMINNGNEQCSGPVIVANGSCDISIFGHFDLNTTDGAVISLRNGNNNIVADNVRMYFTDAENEQPIIESSEETTNSVIINHLNYPSGKTLKNGNVKITDIKNGIIENRQISFNEDGSVTWS